MIRKFSSTIGALLFCALTSMSTSYAQQMLVVRGGSLIDGNGGVPLENATIIMMEGERIREIRATDPGRVPPDAEIIDASGKFIIPGLQDFHVHFRDWMFPSTHE